MTIEDNCFITPPDALYRFAGLRLPEFIDYLKGDRLQPQPGVKQYNDPAFWPKELDMLRWYAIKSKPRASFKSVLLEMLSNHPQSWSHLYGGRMMGDLESCQADMKSIQEQIKDSEKKYQDQNAARKSKYKGIPHTDFVQCTKHFAKVAFRNETIRLSRGPSQWDNRNEAIYFFDDLWAASHRDLATSLLYSGCEGMCALKIPGRSWQ